MKKAWKVIVLVFGVTIILGGVAMLVLPGPGLVTIIAGLALLATEFVWARRLLQRVKDKSKSVGHKVKNKLNGDWWAWVWPWGKNGKHKST